jgi:hypothetical protein
MLVPDRHRDRANALQQLSYPGSVIVAAALAGMLYAAMGVAGAIGVDLVTFVVAIGVLAVVRVPMPPQADAADGAGAAGAGPRAAWTRIWRQSLGGFRILAATPALLALCIYIALVSATAGGFFWSVFTPYLLDRVQATTTYGVVYGIGFSGAILGALAMAAWGGKWPRVHTVMLSTLGAGAGVALVGVARGPVSLAAALFWLTFVIPFANAAISSIFQGRVAPERQGRVFAAMGQLTALLVPLASLIGGPLADRWFEPAVGKPGWSAVAWAVGAGPGSGIGLMYVIAGLWLLGLSVAVYASRSVRSVEHAAPPATVEQPA